MLKQVGRTFDLLDNLIKTHPDKPDIFAIKRNGKWIKYSVKDYYNLSYNLAYALLSKGYGDLDKAISISNNCPEWNIIDMGLNMAGMVHVPVYPTLSQEKFTYIFNHSDAKLIFVGNDFLYNKIKPVIENLNHKVEIIIINKEVENTKLSLLTSISDLYQIGLNVKDKYKDIVTDIKKNTSPNKMATLIYTSGTTGTPKGVMLSHNNMMFNAYIHAVKQIITDHDKMLSFLPLCHIYERSMNYEYQYIGISIYYAESIGTIARDLADSHADGFCGVPRVLEMMYNKLESTGKDFTGIKRIIYEWAWKLGNNFDNHNKKKYYLFKIKLADLLVYSKWREALGGHEMLVVSGGSSIQPKIIRLFNAAKLRIFEGYGMSETSPVIAANSPAQGSNFIGTVGKKMEGTDLKIAKDGEILTRGPHVMLGYYKDEKTTKKVIDTDGWFHTGDIGNFVDGENLKITDRKKEIFKLSAGKYIAPQVIENLIRESPYIENCIVIGENQKFTSAIIIPEYERLHFWAAKHKITYNDNDDLTINSKIIAKIHSEIEKTNLNLSPHEKIKREQLINDKWDISNGLLSQTLKLKRKIILNKYSNIIQSIYKIT
ncbi:MAG: long-chain fatty acid--CoA ligase [Bacteroidales bacterium]